MDKGRRTQYLVATAVSLASVSVGAVLFWLTPVIPKLRNNEAGFQISEAEISWMAALSSPGFIVGSIITRYLSDNFGRQITILGSAVPNIIATIIILFCSAAWMMHLSRVMWGIGSAMISSVSVMYLAEISNKEIRGRISAGNRFMFTFGGFLVMVVGSFFPFYILNYLMLFLLVCYTVSCCFIPESPYYLLKQGKVDAARKALMTLSGQTDEKVLEDRLSDMRSHVRKEMIRSGSLKELITGKQYRKALTIVIGLKFTQMMAGSLALQVYLGAIIQESQTVVSVSTALIIFASVRFVVGICSSILVDKVGRRPLLLYSYFISSIILGIVGTYYFLQPTSPTFSFIPLTGIISFIVMTTLGYSTIGYIILGEVFPINVKSVAITVINILGGLLNFLSMKGYQELKNVAGLTGVFWFYSISALIGAVFTYLVVPETMGKSLRQIQIELQGKHMIDEAEVKLNQVVNENGATTELKQLEHKESK